MLKVGIISNADLCLALLQYLKQQNVTVVLYVGLHEAGADLSQVFAFCNNNGIAIDVEANPQQLYGWLNAQQPDYCFIFCYKTLVDVNRLGDFKQRVFNIHPGKLPQYRGPSPVFWQLKNGEKTLGITIHFLSNKYDTGNIVWQKEISNEVHFSHGLADYILSNIVVEGVIYVLNTGVEGLAEKSIKQDESFAATHKKQALQDVLVHWQTMPAGVVVNLVKACNPWNKGAIAIWNNVEIKIVDAEVQDILTNETPGAVVSIKDGLQVACAGSSVIKINQLTVNGIFVPARFVDKFGFAQGQVFTST